MTASSREYLAEALGHVFVSMAGLPVRSLEADMTPDMRSDALNVKIEFTGGGSGEIGIVMERPLASLVTCRILGRSDAPSPSEDTLIEDALKELANVVCGHFVTLMYGYTSVFKISIPRVLLIGSAACNMLKTNPDVSTFVVESHPLLATVRIR